MSRQGLKGIFDGLGALAGQSQLGGGAFGGQGLANQLGQAGALQQLQQSATEHQMRMQREQLEYEIRRAQAAQQVPRHPYENVERDHITDALVYGMSAQKISIRGQSFREQLQAEVDAWLAPAVAV